MRHNKDILWKGVLEWVFDDLLRFVFPDADQLFDMERGFEYLEKELASLHPKPGEKIDVRYVDKLVKAFRKDGGEEWVLIHIEVQNETKKGDRILFAERMFRYFYRCFDKYQRPVAAIAIFCGPDGKQLPACYNYNFLDTRLQYEYRTLRILDYDDKELSESQNPFAWVMLIAKKALLEGKDLDEKLLKGKLFIFRKLYENGVFEKQKLQAILSFLENYIRFENSETNLTFNKEVDKITGKENIMDIFEQVALIRHQEGVEEGLEKAISKLLTNTKFSATKIASLLEVPVSMVRKVKKKLPAK